MTSGTERKLSWGCVLFRRVSDTFITSSKRSPNGQIYSRLSSWIIPSRRSLLIIVKRGTNRTHQWINLDLRRFYQFPRYVRQLGVPIARYLLRLLRLGRVQSARTHVYVPLYGNIIENWKIMNLVCTNIEFALHREHPVSCGKLLQIVNFRPSAFIKKLSLIYKTSPSFLILNYQIYQLKISWSSWKYDKKYTTCTCTWYDYLTVYLT